MPTIESVLQDALSLSAEDRARLSQRLQPDVDWDPEVREAWEIEIRRRLERLRAGEATIPAEQVFSEALTMLETDQAERRRALDR